MSTILNLPDIRPSLLLDFANSQRVDPRIQCVRASEKIVSDQNGLRTIATGVPSLDFDQISKSCNGLLVESAVQNVALHTHDFTQSAWTKSGVTVTAAQGYVSETATNADHQLAQVHAVAVGEAITFTVVARYNPVSPQKRYLLLLLPAAYFGVNARAVFDLQNGTYAAFSSPQQATMTPQADGSYICSVTHAATTAGNCPFYVRMHYSSSGVLDAYMGDGASGFDVLIANITKAPGRSSLIRSVASATTRAADGIQLSLGDWFNPYEGTLVVGYRLSKTTSNAAVVDFNLSTAAANNRIGVRYSSSGFAQLSVNAGGAQVASIAASGYNSPGIYRCAIAYKRNYFAHVINGTLIGIDSSGELPVVDRLFIASETNLGSFSLNDPIEKIVYYPRALTAAHLQRLTAL